MCDTKSSKRLALLLATSLAASLSQAYAADQLTFQRTTPAPETKDGSPAESLTRERLGSLAHASKLLGMKIQNAQDKNVGKINDLIVDVPNGRVIGAKAHIDGKDQLIPAQSFWPASEERVRLSSSDWQASSHANMNSEQGTSVKSLIGKPIMGNDGEKLGTIKDVMVSVPYGRALYVLVDAAGAARSDSLYLVPPQAIQASSDNFQLKADRSKFLAGPRVNKEYWTEMVLPEFAQGVYRHYDLGTKTAALSPTGRGDRDIEQRFLSELVNHTTMPAVDAPDLRMRVEGGRIVLGGAARNDADKQALVAAAQRVVGPGNVVDQLGTR